MDAQYQDGKVALCSYCTACFCHERVLDSIKYFSVCIEIPSEKERIDHAIRQADLSFLETGSHTVNQVGLELSM